MKKFLMVLAMFVAAITVTTAFSSPAAAQSVEDIEAMRTSFGSADSCWGCELYSRMADVTMEMGAKGSKLFTAGAMSFLNAAMALWVVWQLYLLASPSHANGPAQSIDTIFQRVVLFMIIMFILRADPFEYIMGKYVFPMFNDVMAAAAKLLSGEYAACPVGGASEFAKGGVALICAMHQEMGQGMSLGGYMLWDAASRVSFLPPNFPIMEIIGGLIVFLVFGWMMIMLPFRLFDAMIRIAIVCVILPVAVMAYQFKPTRGFTKQAVTSVIAAALTFLFTAIAVAIAAALLNDLVRPIVEDVKAGTIRTDPFGILTVKQFMILVATACGLAAFIKQAGTIAAEFAGFQGSMGGIGSGAAGAFAGGLATGAVGTGYAITKFGGATMRGGGAALNMGRQLAGRVSGGGAQGGSKAGDTPAGSASLG